MHILITGGTGFLGRAITRELLAHGHQVTALARGVTRAELDPGVNLVRADLLDADATTQAIAANPADVVIHLAGRTNARESFTDPVGYYAANVTGTVNLLHALGQAGSESAARRVVFASTHAVYGSQRDGLLGEADPVQPESPYAASKVSAEQLLAFYARAGEIGAVTLRCFNIAGALDGITDPDRTRILPRIIECASSGRPISVNGDGSVQRDFVHVADVAVAFRLAAESVRPGTAVTYNVGTGTGTSVSDLIAAAERVMNTTIAVQHQPAAGEPQVVIADTKLIAGEIGWLPTQRSAVASIVSDSVRFDPSHAVDQPPMSP